MGAVLITLHIRFFMFAKTMQNINIDFNVFVCSFDASSLLTNVLKICSKALNDESNSQPLILKDVFVNLVSISSSVEFNFNNNMYKHIDEVAMKSPLGLAFSNILLNIMKKRYFLKHESLQSTSEMLMTLLPSSVSKLKQMNFRPHLTAFIHPSNSLLGKRKTNVCHFLHLCRKNRYWF